MGYLYGKGDGKMTRKGDPEKVLLGVEGDITTSAGPVAENDYRDRRANASGNPARFNQKIPSMHLLRNPRQKMGQRLGESPVPVAMSRTRFPGTRWAAGDKKGINHAVTCAKARSYPAAASFLKAGSSRIPGSNFLSRTRRPFLHRHTAGSKLAEPSDERPCRP